MDEGAVISDRGDYSAWRIRYQDYQVSTHCAVSLVTKISQSEASIPSIGQWDGQMWHRSVLQIICHWPRSSQRHTDQCRCWSLSWDHSEEARRILALNVEYCKSAMQCLDLDDVRECCYYWLSQVPSQVYITTITQAYIPLHLVCKYLSTLMIIVSLKSYEWMFMQTPDSYWKLETP